MMARNVIQGAVISGHNEVALKEFEMILKDVVV